MPLSRRSLLVGGAALGAVACLPEADGVWPSECKTLCSSNPPSVTMGLPSEAGRVIEVKDDGLTSGGKLVSSAVGPALKRLVLGLTGKADLKAAWAVLLPGWAVGQVVGIKVNVLNQRVPTHPEVVLALVDQLKEGLGLTASDIVVWDRRLDELTRAGFTSQAMGATVEGTWEDAKTKGSGRGYELGTTCVAGRTSHLSNILTRRVSHLVNLAVMKRHTESGYTGVMKNHYGTIDNPGCFHDQQVSGQVVEKRIEEAIPALNALDEVHTKSRLWLLDATVGICKGGTEDPADCTPNRLLASLDPVALDARGRQVRDLMRGSQDPEVQTDAWLAKAEKAGLGRRTVTLTTL